MIFNNKTSNTKSKELKAMQLKSRSFVLFMLAVPTP